MLSQPTRSDAGYRNYSSENAAQLRLIRWAKGLGFTLREIRQMTDAVGQHAAGHGDRVRSQVRRKLTEVDARMDQLASIRAQLAKLADCRCRKDCPVIKRVVTEPAPGRERK